MEHVRRAAVALGAVTIALGVLAACGSGGTKTAPASTASPTSAGTSPVAHTSIAVGSSTAKASRSTTATATASPTPSRTTLPLPSVSSTLGGPLTPVPSQAATTAPAKPLRSPAGDGGGVSVRITGMTSVKTSGQGVGEIAGQPAVAFTITVTNGSKAVLPVNTAAVTASYGSAATPAVPSTGAPASTFIGAVAPGRSAAATFVFVIPTAQRNRVSVYVTVAAARPVLVFAGSVV